MPRDPVAMDPNTPPAGQWAYPSYVGAAMPQDIASAVPAAAPPSPPPLVVMNRETKRQAKEEKIKVAGQTVDDFMQGGAKAGAPGQGVKVPAKAAREKRMQERMARSGTSLTTTASG